MLIDSFLDKPKKSTFFPNLIRNFFATFRKADWRAAASVGTSESVVQYRLTVPHLQQQSLISSICRTFRTQGVAVMLAMFACTAAYSSENFDAPIKLLSSTHLIEVTSGTELSKLAAAYRSTSYESSSGKLVTFDKWYSTRLADTRLTWMTQMTPEFGLIWGMSTGERGEKYAIAPSVKLGFVYQTKVSHSSTFSVRATSLVGGRIKEKPCSANYGDIGGVQQVNCRLAAANLQPAETLKYLVDTLPRNRNSIFVNYTTFF